MFNWVNGRSGREKSDTPSEEFDTQDEVYQTRLPPTMPVVKKSIDTLVELAVKQRIFLSSHADKLKLELVKERNHTDDVQTGSWGLNGFRLSDEDAIDLVRSSPDTLSNLVYTNYRDTSTLWSKLTSWLRFGAKNSSSGINVADDLAFGLAVCEVVELAGHVLSVVSYAMSSQTPSIGKPLKRKLAFELVSSRHRGRSHSMYLLVDIKNAAQYTASRRTSATLKLDLSLYIYQPLLLNGLSGVAVNISGESADDLPEADIDKDELVSVLSKSGTFVASAVSDFVLDSTLQVSSERAANVTLIACERAINASNTALTTFFRDEYERNEAERADVRRANLEEKLEFKRELERERLDAEALAEADYESPRQLQTQRSYQNSYEYGYDSALRV